MHIALLYKRNAQPDEQVLNFLEDQLIADGHQVFVDRRLTFGLDWAKEIGRQMSEAEAVVPLLSAAAMIDTEILAYEVKSAHDEAQKHQGKPWLLPIRIDFTGPSPEELARVLDPIQPISWTGPDDNQRLVTELLSALHNGPVLRPSLRPEELKLYRGAIPLDAPFYVARPVDEEFYAAMTRRESVVLVKGARQMGKTSVLARGLQRAREAGFKVVLTDFQEINAAQLESADTLYKALCRAMARQLQLEVKPEAVWDPYSGPNENFADYMENQVLRNLSVPLVWGLDEVDQLFHRPFAGEVFGLLRAWHNRRALNPDAPWSQLTLAIAHATEPHLFISNLDQSPFNVGTRLNLQDFTLDEIRYLNGLYGSPLHSEAEVLRLFQLVGGQPYLVHRSLYEFVKGNLDLTTLERQAGRDEGLFADHLGRLLISLSRDPGLCEVVRSLLRGQPCTDERSFYRLRSGGVILGETIEEARLRCQVYTTYLKRHLL